MNKFSEIIGAAQWQGDSVTFNVTEDWGQGRTVFGGMQGAMAVTAMRGVLGNDVPLRSLQVTFIGPVFFGDVTVNAKVLRQGKSATQVQAEIYDDGKLRLIAVGIFGTDRPSELADVPTAEPAKRGRDESHRVKYVEGMMPAFTQHFETHFAEGPKLFSATKHPRAIAYSRHRDDDMVTEAHLVALGDVAPPVAMAALSQFAPASSMNWQLEFVQQPSALTDKPWFRVDAEALASGQGYTWQNSDFWDEDGRLVMLSRQCIAVFG
ncbi:thioesterase family protein [Aurantivibrio plasticivorans]